VHSGLELFTGHRAYLAAMEAWLVTDGGAAFVPIPYWNSANRIPGEFNVVKNEDDGTPRPPLVNLNPNIPKPAQYEWPALCSFEDAADLADAINGWHGSVHCAIGGAMCDLMTASAAPIFWCWHAFVDHIYWEWQRCNTVCPHLLGETLRSASLKMRLAGLKTGGVTRLPRLAVTTERLPFPLPIPIPPPPSFPPPIRTGWGKARGEHPRHEHEETALGSAFITPAEFSHAFTSSFALARLGRGPRVIAQFPAAGIPLKLGSGVDLTVVDL
jgi:hypothetical protein